MFVYIWKDQSGSPFYVGLTKAVGRTNPRNNGNRNWLCRNKLAEVGVDHVVVELRFVESIIAGQELERKLIHEFGRVQTGTGPLTNLSSGGDGMSGISEEGRKKLSEALKNPTHPIRSPDARARHKARMQDPDVKALFSGDANPAKRPEVRAKIKAKWAEPEYRAARVAERTGSTPNFSPEERKKMAERVKNNPAMKSWGERNGKDPEFEAKRIAALIASTPKRLAKMSDPTALALRKERLKATMASPEYAAKRANFDTPEYRAKLSAAKKAYWEKKRAEKLMPT
jgi:hypothetical protein